MKSKPLVSIVIPAKNSGFFMENCLKSIKSQSYTNIETIIVDSKSKDNTPALAKTYKAKLINYSPKVPAGTFDAPHKRNYGVKRSKAEYVFYVDADMELPKGLVAECVTLSKKGWDALIVPENSFGVGVWAKAKNLERVCYWGDDTVEAPRFFRRSAWKAVGGLDEYLGGGGDDWDLYQKMLEKGFKIGRTRNKIKHNEGNLSLVKLIKKRYMYGKDSLKYIKKRPGPAATSYFPIRKSYIRNWRLFLSRPVDSIFFVIMRTSEYFAALAGILVSVFN